LTGTTGSGCLVKTMRPSRNGGMMLCTRMWTRASLSSSKSSSWSRRCTAPLRIILFISHISLSCNSTPKHHRQKTPANHEQMRLGWKTTGRNHQYRRFSLHKLTCKFHYSLAVLHFRTVIALCFILVKNDYLI